MSLSKTFLPPKNELVIPRKRWLHPNITEKLFTGRLSIKTKKKKKTLILDDKWISMRGKELQGKDEHTSTKPNTDPASTTPYFFRMCELLLRVSNYIGLRRLLLV